MADTLFAKKTVESLIAETEEKEHKLKKVLSAFDLTLLGIGAIIGTGIFILTGVAAAKYAGPAIIISFIIAGVVCICAALCYAEFASRIPVAGSAYTYAYATLGEMFAWIIGWTLVLEYTFAAIAVSIGWSGYLVSLLKGIGIVIPAWATQPPLNLPAALIIALITWILIVGIKESSKVNNFIVIIKLTAVILFIAVGIFYVKPANWFPFLPYGFSGVVTAAGIVFFAYLGFDAISTTAEEAKNPKRDLPIGIIASLSICTVLYIIVCLVLTGIVPAVEHSADQAFLNAPIAFALNLIHQNWASGLISIGAIAGLTSVLLVLLIGQPRIFFAMSRDKLLPAKLSQVHPKYQTPYLTTIGTGVIVGIIALLIDIGSAAELCSIGTLFAFVIVCSGIFVLRKTDSNVPIAFRTPAVGFIAPLGILGCLYLMYGLPVKTWIRFLVWLDVGMLIYYFYGRSHSRLAAERKGEQKTTVKYFVKFFSVLTVINGALFGLLSLIVTLQIKYTIGIGDVKSWQTMNMDPVKSLVYSGIVFVVGLAAWFFTKGKESGEKAQ